MARRYPSGLTPLAAGDLDIPKLELDEKRSRRERNADRWPPTGVSGAYGTSPSIPRGSSVSCPRQRRPILAGR